MTLPKSGLQKEVLSLYRRALRIALHKPRSARSNFLLFVRYTFHERVNGPSAVSPRDVDAIEYLLRRGKKQLEELENEGVRDCAVSEGMRVWETQAGRTGLGKRD